MPNTLFEKYVTKYERVFLFTLFLISVFFWLITGQDDPIIIKVSWSVVLLCFLLFWSKNRSIEWYFGIITVGLCLRLWMVSFENFSQLPTQDSIQDFQVFLTFLETDSIFVLPLQTVDGLPKYSAFPALHALAVSISLATGVKSYSIAYFLTFLLYLCFVSSVSSLIILLSSSASINTRILPLCLVIVCFEPISIYWTGQMVRQSFGIVLVLTFYALVLLFSESTYRIKIAILTSVVCIIQPVSHHLSSANALIIICGIAIILITLAYFSPRFEERLPNISANSAMNMAIILAVTTVLWWELVGTYVVPVANSVIDRIWYVFSTAQAEEIETILNLRPEALTPSHIIPLIRLKTLAIFGSVAIGFLFMNWKEYKSGNFFKLNIINSYVLVSFLWFAILFLWAESVRVILCAIPVMAISSGYLMENFWKKSTIRFGFIISVFVGSMVAPYSFGYTPAFYFEDDRDGPELQYGQFSTKNTEIIELIGPEADFTSVFVDNPWALLNDDVSYEQALALRTVPVTWRSDPQAVFCENCTIVLFQGGHRYYHLQGGGGTVDLKFEFSLEEQRIFFQFLEENTHSKVYDNGDGISVFKN